MSWKAKIFKPNWESRKLEKRLQSVSKDNDQGLWNALPGIISSDPDYQVRLAALKRLTSNKAPDPLKRFEFMLERFNSLPPAIHTEEPEQSQFFEKLKTQLSQHILKGLRFLSIEKSLVTSYLTTHAGAKEIETLAKKATSLDVRLAAIEQINANGLLGDIAISESDTRVRQVAVSRIKQTSTLERVAKAIRTRDKKLYQIIQKRLLGFANLNPAETADHQAKDICLQLERMLKAASSGVHPEPAALQAQWQALKTATTPALQQRYKTLLATITTTADGSAIRETVVVDTETEPHTEEITPVVPPEPSESELKELQADHDKRLQEKQAKARAAERVEVQAKRQTEADAAVENVRTAQDKLAVSIDAVALKQAVELLQSIRKQLSSLRKNRMAKSLLPALEGRQSRLHGKVKALRDYQHWANNKIRSEMIIQLQSISTVDLHPDAVKNSISDARKKWQQLEASEQLPGDKYFHAPASLWREFNQTCDLAFKLIQPFLEKRHEIQGEHLREDRQLLADGKQLLEAEEASTSALIQQQRKLRMAIRELDKIPAKQRGKTAKVIRAQLDQLQVSIGSEFEKIATEKSRLIRQAEQLAHVEDQQQAINQAKQLQRQWQAAGNGSRKKEQPMWEIFRGHLDPLFKQQADQQTAEKEADLQQLALLKACCTQLEDLAKLPAIELSNHSGKFQALQQDWQEQGGPALRHEHKLRQRFQAAQDLYHQGLEDAGRQQRLLQRKNWQLKDTLLMKLQEKLSTQPDNADVALAATVKKWPKETATTRIDKLLDQRFQEIQQQQKSADLDPALDASEQTKNQYRDLCLTLEYLAGLESPKAEKQARMDMQIKRLANNLSGEVARIPLAEEFETLETSWYQLTMLSEKIRKPYQQRFLAAVEELLLQLNT
ncbi:MAG: hypothetical protein L3J24_01600 [Xanthomonadales bacterium]|nr:hypothetical protein [Xanthomonadales bacterium]